MIASPEAWNLALLVGSVVGGYVGGRRGAAKAVKDDMRREVAAGVAAHESRCPLARVTSPILTPSGRWPLVP